MKRPAARSDFLSLGDELNYLSDMARYFASKGESNSGEAIAFMQRFSKLLRQSGLDDGSIVLQEHWALFHEINGDIPAAIKHQEREIELIERLFAIGGPVGPINRTFLTQAMKDLLSNYVRQGETAKADQLRIRIKQARKGRTRPNEGTGRSQS